MTELRIARPDETGPQREIWKKCFGDDDAYIDFYFTHRYRYQETALALVDGQIASMLTMLQTRLIFPDRRATAASMYYAIATHPDFRGRGLASKVMNFADDFLTQQGVLISMLVPANPPLFKFYDQRGYEERFYRRETTLTSEQIMGFVISDDYDSIATSATPAQYNKLRADLLTDRLYVDYTDEDITYQKHLARNSGGDIYRLKMGKQRGCGVAERLSPDRVLIKELLAPEPVMHEGLYALACALPAREYVVRMPAYVGSHLGGEIRCMGMVKTVFPTYTYTITGQLGYLGISFD